MQDLINSLMLVCASLASMALGVLLAYGICRIAFAALRLHARSIATQAQRQTQSESQIPESQVQGSQIAEPQTASL
jgi:hypothetical protein